MPGNIVDIRGRLPGYRHSSTGTPFPHLYRARGYHRLDSETDEPDTEAGHVEFFALSQDFDTGLVNVVYTPIKHLDPSYDRGWLVIRHHDSEETVNGYVSAIFDFDVGRSEFPAPLLFRSSAGLFTICRREPLPGRPDHLILYFATEYIDLPSGRLGVDRIDVIRPDGTLSPDNAEINRYS